MIKIKSGTNLVNLLHAVKDTRGDVWFHTAQGDRLNMKSLLNQYIFLAAAKEDESFCSSGEIVCDNEDDAAKLLEYV